jgi:HNH endonuclease
MIQIDPEDAWLLDAHRWYIGRITDKHHYVMAKHEGRTIYLHRLIMGVTDRKLYVDHRNHDGLDNRRENLRVTTNAQNQANREGGSGSIGLHKGRWRWRLRVGNGRRSSSTSGSTACSGQHIEGSSEIGLLGSCEVVGGESLLAPPRATVNLRVPPPSIRFRSGGGSA